jgi:acyl-coenzyme A synthetase/AMP-(fatty) acid ligase
LARDTSRLTEALAVEEAAVVAAEAAEEEEVVVVVVVASLRGSDRPTAREERSSHRQRCTTGR